MKYLLLMIAILIPVSVNADDRHSRKHSIWAEAFEVEHISKKELARREAADKVHVARLRKERARKLATPVNNVPLSDDEISYWYSVRASQMREGRIVSNLENRFSILMRHRDDNHFATSTLGYRVITGNGW